MPSTPLSAARRPTAADRVARRIHFAISTGQLQPGDRLIQRPLARRLSTTPWTLRSALIQLAAKGVVDYLPGRGAVVPGAGPPELLLNGRGGTAAPQPALPRPPDRLITQLETEKLHARLGRGGDGLVVDVGCGTGVFTRLLANWGYTTLGLDWDAEQVSLARRASPPTIRYAQHDFTRDTMPGDPPFPPRTVDLITTRLSLHCLPRPLTWTTWARHRWLRPGGRLYVMTALSDGTTPVGLTDAALDAICDGWQVLHQWQLAQTHGRPTHCLLLRNPPRRPAS
ncbi:methyltransferase domain-containing protein [Streptomyces sp. AJS327]|uniref:methyltransferase domain-containing protein n=1 Tax=Streptomyces sp. AJS327 TaxID=2545265 RepID=UPI0015E01A07|nr:methyltransferase domain-containing protein [Streptomyces sp. AJS327]